LNQKKSIFHFFLKMERQSRDIPSSEPNFFFRFRLNPARPQPSGTRCNGRHISNLVDFQGSFSYKDSSCFATRNDNDLHKQLESLSLHGTHISHTYENWSDSPSPYSRIDNPILYFDRIDLNVKDPDIPTRE